MPATLTALITAGDHVTALHVTAMPSGAQPGEIVFASLSLDTVEAFTVQSLVTIGDLVIHVEPQVAASTHHIGDEVEFRRNLTAVGREFAPLSTPRFRKL